MGFKSVPKQSPVAFAPGDQVIRYVNGEPFFCTVIEVEADGSVRVSCNLWPRGYSAVVNAGELALVSRASVPLEVA